MEHLEIQDRIEELSGRLDKLAARNRRLRLIGIILGAGLAAMATVHFGGFGSSATAQEKAEPGPVKATSFQVVDDSGKVMAELKCKDKVGTLGLMGTDGKPSLIVLGGENPGVLSYDSGGNVRSIIGFEKKTGPVLVFKDSKGSNRMVMSGDDKAFSMIMLSAEKKNRVILSGGDAPALLMMDNSAIPRTIVGFEEQSGPFMALRDERGKNRLVAAYGANTIGYSVLDDDGKPTWSSQGDKSAKPDKPKKPEMPEK